MTLSDLGMFLSYLSCSIFAGIAYYSYVICGRLRDDRLLKDEPYIIRRIIFFDDYGEGLSNARSFLALFLLLTIVAMVVVTKSYGSILIFPMALLYFATTLPLAVVGGFRRLKIEQRWHRRDTRFLRFASKRKKNLLALIPHDPIWNSDREKIIRVVNFTLPELLKRRRYLKESLERVKTITFNHGDRADQFVSDLLESQKKAQEELETALERTENELDHIESFLVLVEPIILTALIEPDGATKIDDYFHHLTQEIGQTAEQMHEIRSDVIGGLAMDVIPKVET